MDKPQQAPKRIRSKPLREIRKEQNSVKTIIPSAPFRRLVFDGIRDKGGPWMRIRKEAVEALQQGVEDYIVYTFRNANKIARAANRETVHRKDIKLLHSINDDDLH